VAIERGLTRDLQASVQDLVEDFRTQAWRSPAGTPLPVRRRSIETAIDIPGDDGAWTRASVSPLARDALRAVYARMLAALPEEEHGIFAVCSAVEGEGKTTVAVGVAQMLAEELRESVLLIDAHARGPRVHDLLDAPLAPGLFDCVESGGIIMRAIHRRGDFWVMPAGHVEDARLVDSYGLSAVLRPLREIFRIIIIDLPAALRSPDAILISRWADRVVWVVRADSTPADKVADAIEMIGPSKVLGVVLNGSRSRIPGWLEKLI
jgi:Mrp family chromosome partitioning ATPase